MNDLAALAYADLRSLVNTIRDIRRSPARAIIWLVFVGLIGFGIVFRIRFGPHGGTPESELALDNSAVAFTFVLIGLNLVSSRSRVGLFRHRAEARWIIGSPISPFVATIYLQLRETLLRTSTQLLSFALLFVWIVPATSKAALWRDIAFFVLIELVINTVPLPRRLARGASAAILTAVGWATLAAAAYLWLVPFARTLPPDSRGARLAAYLPVQNVGVVLSEPPNLRSAIILIVLLAITLTIVISLARIARDAFPELYAVSLDRIERTESLRQSIDRRKPRRSSVERSATRTLPGVLALVWRSWVEVRRRTSVRSVITQLVVLFGIGYGVGWITNADEQALFVVSGIFATILVFFSVGYGVLLGLELAKPLFRLSAATMFERLAALLVAQTWQLFAWIALIIGGVLAGGGTPEVILRLAVAGPVIVILVAAVGYVLFALFPSEIDQRGPLVFVRLLLGLVALMPPFAGAIATIAIAPAFALPIFVMTALMEAGACLGVAAWRLDNSTAA